MTQNTNTEKMTLAEFEERLPEFFSTGTGSISDDPRLQAFLLENPDAAALVSDFGAIVDAARKMFVEVDDEGSGVEPSDAVWQNIQSGLQTTAVDMEVHPDTLAAKPAQ